MSVNSAGTLVGAVLESAGYIYQANLLATLTDPLKNEVGALIYLLGVAIVIVQFVVLKSAKMAPWLLIGPAVFSAVILNPVPIEQARWSFGSNDRNQAEVTIGTQKVTDGQSGSANVSKVFQRFVLMTSEVTRSIVDTINGVQLKNDLWFIAKGQFFGAMTNFKEEDAGLQGLIHYGLSGHCFDVIQAAKAVNNPIYRLNATSQDLPGNVKGSVDDARRFWVQSQTEALKVYNELLNLPEHSFQNNPKVIEYIKKLAGGGANSIENDTLYSCNQIWKLTLAGILEKSAVIEEGLEEKAKELGIEVEAFKNLAGQASGVDRSEQLLSTSAIRVISSEDIARIIAKYFLRNEMRTTEIGSQIAQFAGRHDLRKLDTRLEGDFSSSERDRLSIQEWSEKERLAHAAYSMPVYQGLILYFLGVTFPFFALLLLIPGKSSGFLIWFALWIWAKSWDIGLAIVMQLDTIFWSLYAVQKQRMGANDFIPDDLSTAMVAIEQMDPTFQMSGYYSLLAVCVLAIPPVTANLILGSMRAGSSIISAGVNQFSDFFASNMAARVQQGAITALKSDAISLRDLRGLAYSLGGKSRKELLEGHQERDLVSRARMENGETSSHTNLSKAVVSPSSTTPRHMDIKQFQATVDTAIKINKKEGIVAPLRVLGTSGDGLGDNLVKLFHSGLPTEKAIADGSFEKLRQLAASEVAQARFEGEIDAMAYELHKRLANFGAIPVPWTTGGDDGSGVEVQRHLAEYGMRMNILKSYADVAGQVLELGVKTPEEFKKIWKTKEEEKKPDNFNWQKSLGYIGLGAGADWLSDAGYSKLLGLGLNEKGSLDDQAKKRAIEFDSMIPDILKPEIANYLQSQGGIVTTPEGLNPRSHIDLEFGGDFNELAERAGEGVARRPIRAQRRNLPNNEQEN